MEIEKNNNKELVPLEHYLEEYAKASPEEMRSEEHTSELQSRI